MLNMIILKNQTTEYIRLLPLSFVLYFIILYFIYLYCVQGRGNCVLVKTIELLVRSAGVPLKVY